MPDGLRQLYAARVVNGIKHLGAGILALLKFILMDADGNAVWIGIHDFRAVLKIGTFSFSNGRKALVPSDTSSVRVITTSNPCSLKHWHK